MDIGGRKERGKLKGNWSVNVGKASISDVESEQEVGKGYGKWKLERKQVLAVGKSLEEVRKRKPNVLQFRM
jgi:hypothetical protein